MNKFLLFLLFSHSLLFSQKTTNLSGQTCSKILDCLKIYSNLTGKKFLFDKNIKGEISFSDNLKLTKQNSEVLISEILSMAGLAKAQVNKNLWKVITARDIRYTPTALIDGYNDEIPQNTDYIQALFKLKNKDIAHEIVRNFRPFMTRYGRILDIKRSNSIIITDTGYNIARLKKLITFLDIPEEPLSSEELKNQEEEEEFHRQLALLKAKNGTSDKKYYKEELTYFREKLDRIYDYNLTKNH